MHPTDERSHLLGQGHQWSNTAGRTGPGRRGVPYCRGPGPPYPTGMHLPSSVSPRRLRAGMVGLGMIFDETYRPLFEQLHAQGLYRRDLGAVDVELAAVASRT